MALIGNEAGSLAPFFDARSSTADRDGVLYCATDSCGRRVALRVFERNSGLPADTVAQQSYSRLTHPHLQALYSSGTLPDGRFFAASRWLDGCSVAASERSFEEETIARAAFELASALAFLHSKGFVHRNINADTVWRTADGFVLAGSAQVTARRDSSRLQCDDIVLLGLALLRAATGPVRVRRQESRESSTAALQQIHSAPLRRLLARMVSGGSYRGAEELFSECVSLLDRLDSSAARSCLGYERRIDRNVHRLFESGLAEVRRGHGAALAVTGRSGTLRGELIADMLDGAGPGFLSLRADLSAGAWGPLSTRLQDSLEKILGGLAGPAHAARVGTSVFSIARALSELLRVAGRQAAIFSVELDPEPASDDTRLLVELLAHLRDCPVLVIAHASIALPALGPEIRQCHIERRTTADLVEDFYIPGPCGRAIRRRIALEAGGDVEMFKEGLHSAIRARGARALDGTWKGRGATLLASSHRDRILALPAVTRSLLPLLYHAPWPLPLALFSGDEWIALGEAAWVVDLIDRKAVMKAEVRGAARAVAGSRRAASIALLERLEGKADILLPGAAMAWLLQGAGRREAAIAWLKEAGLEALERTASHHVHALFTRLAPYATASDDGEFWALWGDWAARGERYREAIGHYQQAIGVGGPASGRVVCACVEAAEQAADYRTAVRLAESELAGNPAPETILTLRCLAARSRFVLGDAEAAAAHWGAAYELCKRRETMGPAEGGCLRDYGYFLSRRGDKEGALELLEAARRVFEQLPESVGEVARTMHYLGLVEKDRGELAAAKRNLDRAARLYAESENLLQQGKVASDLGVLHIEEEEWEEARRALDVSLNLFGRIRNPRAVTLASYNLAEVMVATGEYHQAAKLLNRCLRVDRSSGNLRSMAYDLSSLGMLCICSGNPGGAAEYLDEALEVFSSQGDEEEAADTMLKQIRLRLETEPVEAASLIRTLEEKVNAFSPKLRRGFSILKGRAALACGDWPRAAALAKAVLEEGRLRSSEETEAALVRAEALFHIGKGRDSAAFYARALAASVRSANPYLQAGVRLSWLERNPREALTDTRFLEATEEILDRSGHRGMIERYRGWYERSRDRLELPPLRRLAPPGVESEVYRISRRVGEGNPDEAVASLVLDAIIERLGADLGVLVLKVDGGDASVVARRGEAAASMGAGDEVLRIATDAMRSGANLIIAQGSGEWQREIRALGAVSAMAIPLFRKGSASGAIYLERRGTAEEFSQENAEFVAALADGLAMGLRQSAASGSPGMARSERPAAFGRIIAASERMDTLMETAARVAPRDVSVLICGESGTGKELLARAIHETSGRRPDRFVGVNCSAIPEALLESEFFGYKRGAFTDARADRAGLLEEADGGTLFLDEISEMSLKLQAKLLRVVQEKEFRRIGDTRTRAVDLRVISATNKDLAGEVAAGRFREDLFYRLQVVALRVPPLRERREDVLPLAGHYLARYATNAGVPVPRIGSTARAWLLRHRWPGNVRELQNALQRALLAAGTLTKLEREHFDPDDVVESCARDAASLTYGEACLRFESAFLQESLRRAGGNKSVCARDLGLSRQGLFKLTRKLGIDA